ncbi:MAG: hypothetical protein HYW88_01345 [Candidatus Sungbacteria bacterium]|nr:hypothetical protein [Candidatus Sungbacteria bacterium]
MDIVKKVAEFLRTIGLPIAVIMILFAGFTYMTAGGNPEKVKLAHRIFVWSLVGLAVLLVAENLVEVVCKFLGGTNCA